MLIGRPEPRNSAGVGVNRLAQTEKEKSAAPTLALVSSGASGGLDPWMDDCLGVNSHFFWPALGAAVIGCAHSPQSRAEVTLQRSAARPLGSKGRLGPACVPIGLLCRYSNSHIDIQDTAARSHACCLLSLWVADACRTGLLPVRADRQSDSVVKRERASLRLRATATLYVRCTREQP